MQIYRDFALTIHLDLETIPSTVLVTPYQPDIVIYNRLTSSMEIIELTCPPNSSEHLESARTRKQFEPEYVQLLAKLDQLMISHSYRIQGRLRRGAPAPVK